MITDGERSRWKTSTMAHVKFPVGNTQAWTLSTEYRGGKDIEDVKRGQRPLGKTLTILSLGQTEEKIKKQNRDPSPGGEKKPAEFSQNRRFTQRRQTRGRFGGGSITVPKGTEGLCGGGKLPNPMVKGGNSERAASKNGYRHCEAIIWW